MTEVVPPGKIVGLLVNTARAHHEATGGVNPEWASWYAERMIDELNGALEADIDTDELADWLADADRRYRAGPQTESWPKAYARWLVDEFGTHSA